MSSFVGHSLAALTIFSFNQRSGSQYLKLVWLIWLVILASAPDVDYIFDSLSAYSHQGIRITHSVILSLALPLCTVVVLFFLRLETRTLKMLGAEATGAGLSHLILDFLVGVTPLPLLWPFSTTAFKFSFGLLPSAGGIELSNYYFYRNLLIEMGILIPLFYGGREIYYGQINLSKGRMRGIMLILVITIFLVWSISLSR